MSNGQCSCACTVSDDKSTIVSSCGLHAAWLRKEVTAQIDIAIDFHRKEIATLRQTICHLAIELVSLKK